MRGKGLIERAHDYLERSFLSGRTFTGSADFNIQLAAWVAVVNTCRPACSPAIIIVFVSVMLDEPLGGRRLVDGADRRARDGPAEAGW